MTSPPDERVQADEAPVTTRVGDALVVTLPREIDDPLVRALRTVVLDRVRRGDTNALVFEASGLDLIDADEFAELSAVARTASWLGVRPMIVGLRPGVVAYLVHAGVDTSAFEAHGALDDALDATRLGSQRTASIRGGSLAESGEERA